MASAAVATRACCSSTSSAASRFLTRDFARQDFFAGKREVKVTSTRRSLPVITAAVQNSSGAPIRYGNACIDLPCAVNCPVNTPTSRNVDRWVEESVHEIVKNIQEAPFLQYVFDSKRSSRYGRFKRQKIAQEVFENPSYWPSVRESFSSIDAPDGVILVQRLKTGEKKTCCLADAMQQGGEQVVCPVEADGGETNVWGVLVQARGSHVNACYLLKTTRVTSSVGTCTRYCLTRATCFGPSYLEQLETAWLL